MTVQMLDVKAYGIFFVIKQFRSNGPCIIERNKSSSLQLKIWLNTRLDFIVIEKILNIYCVISFDGILNFKEQTWFFNKTKKKTKLNK